MVCNLDAHAAAQLHFTVLAHALQAVLGWAVLCHVVPLALH